MHTPNAKQNLNSADPVWILLAEFSFRDFVSDRDQKDGLMARLMVQAMREIGMSPESMENVTRMLAGFAKEALAHLKQGRLECPGRIRIFCQRKMINDAYTANISRNYPTEQGKVQKQIYPDSESSKIGGWGYFMIERGENLLPHSSGIPYNSIDLYLYKEGE